MATMLQPQPFISLEEAHDLRSGEAWKASLAKLGNVLRYKDFDPYEAEAAFEECERIWAFRFGTKAGCFDLPWSDDFDVGQCANWAVKRDLSHPLIMACRWGSSKALIWLCGKEGIGPTVRFQGVAEFWPAEMAAEHGLAGTLTAMLSMKGICRDEALSSWLVGCSNAPKGAVRALVDEARPWIDSMDNGLPVAPSTVFGSGLTSAICRDENDESCSSEEAVAALCSLGTRCWVHESDMVGSETWSSAEESRSCPRNFFEDALGNGNAKAIGLLAQAGFALPSRDRFDWLVEDWGLRKEGKADCIDAMLGIYAGIESLILDREAREVGSAAIAKRKFL